MLFDVLTCSETLVLYQVLGICFSPNGYHLATAGEDDTCRIWDLRKRKCSYIIPAHSCIISQVKFEPQEGYFLATASYDTKAMVWSARDFKPVKTLIGHEGRVTDLDITGGMCLIIIIIDFSFLYSLRRANVRSPYLMEILFILGTADGQIMATVAHDKTIKIWTCKNDKDAMEVDDNSLA